MVIPWKQKDSYPVFKKKYHDTRAKLFLRRLLPGVQPHPAQSLISLTQARKVKRVTGSKWEREMGWDREMTAGRTRTWVPVATRTRSWHERCSLLHHSAPNRTPLPNQTEFRRLAVEIHQEEVVCKHKTRRKLHDRGFILNAFEIHKSWNSRTVIMEMEQAFKEKNPMDTSIELLMACGSKLVAPKLHSGQELGGLMLHKIFKAKALYVRPSNDLCKLDSTDSEDSMELDEEDNRSASNEHIMTTRGRNRRSHTQVPVETRARANQPPPQVPPDQPPPQAPRYQPPQQAPRYQPPPQEPRYQPPPQEPRYQPPPQEPRYQPPPQVPSDLQTDNSLSRSALVSDNYDTYLSIMGAMPDLSSDEEVNEAILASLESHPFNINRSAVLDGAVRGFKRVSYNPTFQMFVMFSDDFGVDEEAVDLGGPRREFLRLLMEALAHSQMFEGREGKANLALESSALRKDQYFFAGQAIAVSLVHSGPAPGFCSYSLYSSLTGRSPKPEMEEIADLDLYAKVKKATEPLTDYLANAGCLRPLKGIEDKDLLVEDILMFQVVHRVSGAFERFREGMKTLGVLDAIRMHPVAFRPLMCHEPSPLTADVLENLFVIRLSAVGSNRRRAEECVVPFWRDYLMDIEGRHLPTANTCINCLKLPLVNNYEDFKDSMEFAFRNTQGFGQE
ncbi:G2/M phase-specific E3 ubiquitin-protein ligase [Merluccius polli]|uniref:HECT-type E3 ubiquitin transferase n=1 Tax=Merluccius polli TaxID=89951 RepID=A0AA47N7H2_MERPO|nr:G2/M phase-specific E3 ubiquitin-protein ligase [Merluccius polli]